MKQDALKNSDVDPDEIESPDEELERYRFGFAILLVSL
jgi:hypothetical protein